MAPSDEVFAGYENAKNGQWAAMKKVVIKYPEECVKFAKPGSLYTFLHQVAYNCSSTNAQFLLDLGADPTALNASKQTPAMVAEAMPGASKPKKDCVKLLRDAAVLKGYEAAKAGDFEVALRAFEAHTAETNAFVSGKRWTYLHQAACKRRGARTCSFWRANTVSGNLTFTLRCGLTDWGNVKAAEALLKSGASPTVTNKSEGETPAGTAARMGHPACANLLVQAKDTVRPPVGENDPLHARTKHTRAHAPLLVLTICALPTAALSIGGRDRPPRGGTRRRRRARAAAARRRC